VNIFRSEWTKFRGLRSTWLTAAVTVVLGVGISVLATSARARSYPELPPADRAGWDPTMNSLSSNLVAQLAIGVLGVLMISGEYATGSIQPSLLAVPRRGRLLAAKAAVFAAAAVLLGQLIGFTSFLVGQSVFAGFGVPYATLGQPEALRAVVGGGLFLAAVGLLGLGLGTVLRSTAGGIGTLVSLTLLVPLIAQTLPERWARWVSTYWPPSAGRQIYAVVRVDGAIAPWPGLGLLCGFVALVGAAGYAVLRARDA
jgi:ABC-type transport system involved in multi-copper enzyme maturation permease subunit